jgi:2-polyprenyl-6-methoxyphenol hydroxylase-like FAD-dependent oxidoreductase
MRVLVVGAGPAGLMVAAALARRGHQLTVVDRDPGPTAAGWHRRGVMQFEHAHGFRPQVALVLEDEWPAAYDAWLRLGAEPVEVPNPTGPRPVVIMRSRRSTFERALREAAATSRNLDLRTGHVDRLVTQGSRVTGAVVDGSRVDADLVVDASGRSGRVAGLPGGDAVGLDGSCGLAYVDRTYRLREGASPGPMRGPIGWNGEFVGYQTLVFPHERGHFSVVLIRPTADEELKVLHREEAFDAACRLIPPLAEWTQDGRAVPTSRVMVGGNLRNVYHRHPAVAGHVRLGDSVATTTPTRGRGIALAAMQLMALLGLVDDGADLPTVAEPFGAWCDAALEPWVEDHIEVDGWTVRRWQGDDVDLTEPLTSDLIARAALADERIAEVAAGYQAMTAPPASLRAAEPWARAVYETGWRPPYDEGPTRDELLAGVTAAVPVG